MQGCHLPTCPVVSTPSPPACLLPLQVVAGLDDVLMGLAELQLQLDSTNSCAACLAKAVRCMERLSTKKTVEVGG